MAIENYIIIRSEIMEIFEKAKKTLEKKSEDFIGKKSYHFPKISKRSI